MFLGVQVSCWINLTFHKRTEKFTQNPHNPSMSYKQWVIYDPRPYLKDTLTFFTKYRVDKMWISLLVTIIKLWTTESNYKKPNIHARTWCDRSKTILRFSKCMERAGIIDPGLETTHPGPVFPSWGSDMRTWRWSSWSHSGVRLSFETFHTLMNSGPELSVSCVLADYFLSPSQMNSFFFLSFLRQGLTELKLAV